MAPRRTSIERGRMESALCGARQTGAYCEVMIKVGGTPRPHVVDLTLVPGYSSLDHMADVPLAAAVEAIGGKTFRSRRAAEGAADKARGAALRGGPRIDYTFTPGTLRERFFAENAAALRAAVVGRDGRAAGVELPTLYDLSPQGHGHRVFVRDGETRVSVRVVHSDGYAYRQIWAADRDDLCDPAGVRWSHVKDIYPV